MLSSRSRRSTDGRGSNAAHDSSAMHLTVKVPASKLRQATTGARGSGPVSASAAGSRRPTRGAKKRYIESDSDDDEEDEEQDEIKVGEDDEEAEDDETPEQEEEDDEMEDLGDEDAEGEEVDDDDDDDDDDMEVDAEDDDEDADGDVDMDITPAPPPPTIKISKPAKNQPLPAAGKTKTYPAATKKAVPILADDDDEELSELDSDVEDEINDTVRVGGQVGDEDAEGEVEEDDVDLDAEGEEIEVADEDGVGADSDDEDGSRAGTPDLAKMTRRQRARFDEEPQEYMKLSDGKSPGVVPSAYDLSANPPDAEVQAKKVFTAEELSVRRQEMARRRRNLSEKRNEEVKVGTIYLVGFWIVARIVLIIPQAETINKLLKRQAPKTNRRNAGDETPDGDGTRAEPAFVRWVNSKEGSRISVPEEILEGPAGAVFGGSNARGFGGRRMVEEVS